jgi:hypothetical protein
LTDVTPTLYQAFTDIWAALVPAGTPRPILDQLNVWLNYCK